MGYQKSDNSLMRATSKFVCAQTSAISAGYVSYPFDTVRRRLQMQSEKPESEWVYKGTADCFGKIVKEEGTSALFKGAGANLCVPSVLRWCWYFTLRLLGRLELRNSCVIYFQILASYFFILQCEFLLI